METARLPLLVAALSLFIAAGNSSAAESIEESAGDNEPSVAILPPAFLRNVMLTTGCWARLHAAAEFSGGALNVAGPVDLPKSQLRPALAWGGVFNSLIVGPKATVIAFENEDYTDRSATFQPGQRVPALEQHLGAGKIRSLRITCSV